MTSSPDDFADRAVKATPDSGKNDAIATLDSSEIGSLRQDDRH